MPEKVWAEWVGGYAGIIPGVGRISPGDKYQIHLAEAFGSTTYTDPVTKQVKLIGPGQVAMAEHAGIPKEQLQEMGYRFDEPSSNWKPLEPLEPQTYAQTELPQEVDLSEFYVPDQPAEPEATPELEASKDDSGCIEIVTTLPPPPPEPEPPAEAAPAPASSDES